MKKLLLSALVLSALLGCSKPAQTKDTAKVEFQATKDFVRMPEVNGSPTNMHGDVAVSSKGEVYVSTMDAAKGVQVFSPDGKFLRNVPNAPADFHGFVIHKDKDGEFIYGPRLVAHTIVKMTLDGKIVKEVSASVIPDKFKKKAPATKKGPKGDMIPNPDAGKIGVRMTAMDVTPSGDWYVTDGYSSDFVHHFDRDGKYIKSFGGKEPPYSFATLHKIAIDTRFTPNRIIGVDRANGRVVHMSLNGDFLGVIVSNLILPAAVAVQGDYAVIGEIKGRVTLLDKAGKIVTQFGANDRADEVGSNKAELPIWRPGFVTAPHGVAFDAKGNVYVSEYNTSGRVHKFVRK